MIPILKLFVFFCISFLMRYDFGWTGKGKEEEEGAFYQSQDGKKVIPTFLQLERLATLLPQ